MIAVKFFPFLHCKEGSARESSIKMAVSSNAWVAQLVKGWGGKGNRLCRGRRKCRKGQSWAIQWEGPFPLVALWKVHVPLREPAFRKPLLRCLKAQPILTEEWEKKWQPKQKKTASILVNQVNVLHFLSSTFPSKH